MTNTPTDPLDQLYEAATQYLDSMQHRSHVFKDEVAGEELLVNMNLGVIDRWLARHETDRQFELQRHILDAQTGMSNKKEFVPAGVAEGFQDRPTCTCDVCDCLWKQEDDPKLASAELCIFCFYGRHKNLENLAKDEDYPFGEKSKSTGSEKHR